MNIVFQTLFKANELLIGTERREKKGIFGLLSCCYIRDITMKISSRHQYVELLSSTLYLLGPNFLISQYCPKQLRKEWSVVPKLNTEIFT